MRFTGNGTQLTRFIGTQARDSGTPFSKWVGAVDRRYHLPVNAIIVTALFTVIISLISLGSSIAFNAILSLGATCQMATYSVSISCVLWRRIVCPDTLPHSEWSLGRSGILVNSLGAAYSWYAFFWGFWPESTPVDATSMVSLCQHEMIVNSLY